MSHLTQSMVEQLFEVEKESARGVLDSAMDTIFKQMKRKLMQLVDNVELANETGHGLAHLGGTIDREQQLYESFNDFNPIPSTTTDSHISDLKVSNLSEHDGSSNLQHHKQQFYSNLMTNDTNPIPSATTKFQSLSCDLNASNLSQLDGLGDRVHYEQINSSSNQIPSSSINSRVHDNTSNQFHDDDEVIVKNELGEIVNIIPNEPLPSISVQPSNEQSNDNNEDDFDDDEDCDCSECVGDMLVVKEEGDDQEEEEDDDDVQFIDETDDSNPKPTKRPRLENDQSQDQSQPNNQTTQTQITTISLKCPQCSQMLHDRKALNAHLKSVHSIERYRCLYKHCNRSFNNHRHLGHHYRTTHLAQPNSSLSCGYCSGHFKNCKSLHTHHLKYHEGGLFQCAHANCDFTGEFIHLVSHHFIANHKPICKTVACNYPSCLKKFVDFFTLKSHERVHRGVRPFRCRWLGCTYDSAYKSDCIKHIRTQHLAHSNHLKDVDPKVYLEVMADLL